MVNVPALVGLESLGNGTAIMAGVDRHVMLIAVPTHVLHQLLQSWNLHHTVPAETLRTIIRGSTFPHVGAHPAVQVVSGSPAVSNGSALQLSYCCWPPTSGRSSTPSLTRAS